MTILRAPRAALGASRTASLAGASPYSCSVSQEETWSDHVSTPPYAFVIELGRSTITTFQNKPPSELRLLLLSILLQLCVSIPTERVAMSSLLAQLWVGTPAESKSRSPQRSALCRDLILDLPALPQDHHLGPPLGALPQDPTLGPPMDVR